LGINFKGQKANSAALPPTGNTVNDGWVMVDTGHTWVWTGTAWVDVGIISGPAGAQGIQGLQGVDGPQGPAGTQGIKGDTGDVGPIGPQGIQGPQGVQGIQGDTGLQGPQGPAGATETGASILAKLAPVDGAASGLDADKVDGLDSLDLLARTNHTGVQAISTIVNLQATLDLTGVVPKAEIRFEPGGAVIVTFVTEVVLPNIIAMSLSSTQCQALEIAPHIWDLQLTYPSGSVNTILMGTVEVTADVTDSVAAGALMAQPTTIAMQQGKTLKFPRAARKKG